MNNYLLKNARLYRNHCFEETDILVQKVRERICQLSIKLASAKNSKRFRKFISSY